MDRAIDLQPDRLMPSALQTPRLLLRMLCINDVPEVTRLAGDRAIADTTISIPHPMTEEQARAWVLARASFPPDASQRAFAITRSDDGRLVGAISLRDINHEHAKAELGFWIGVEFWGHGYATEAVRRVVQFGFATLPLNRIYAHHMVRNPASAHVLDRAGLKPEGLLRQAVRKWGQFEDVVLRSILRSDWLARKDASNVGSG
jgi:[ribosomal protein S5]-alanine N-acetyltransferase